MSPLILQLVVALTRNELKATKENHRKQKEELERQWTHQDDLEQYSRKNSREIHGIPQDAYPSTKAAVIKVSEALNITAVEPENIKMSHKLNHGRAYCEIIISQSYKVKSKLFN